MAREHRGRGRREGSSGGGGEGVSGGGVGVSHGGGEGASRGGAVRTSRGGGEGASRKRGEGAPPGGAVGTSRGGGDGSSHVVPSRVEQVAGPEVPEAGNVEVLEIPHSQGGRLLLGEMPIDQPSLSMIEEQIADMRTTWGIPVNVLLRPLRWGGRVFTSISSSVG
ncbi:rRNA 2'-O-methyltransferase fibrillarin-like [Rosa rugosa]|uniref:rRNA 2'-O-methyltransferase fibrillarin-like n=1 Tax=Rosa rugosa TaxID=74645 RepID=UPI002B405972|nr:rRNA 2'-O-methyltransferase fibrillarin-like [Rosa rugosa]